jgi:hypothetical protein
MNLDTPARQELEEVANEVLGRGTAARALDFGGIKLIK